MKQSRVLRATLFALCAALCLMASNLNVQAQADAATKQAEKSDTEINLDTQLFPCISPHLPPWIQVFSFDFNHTVSLTPHWP